MKGRLAELRAVVPYAVEPSTLLGATVGRAVESGGKQPTHLFGHVLEHDEGSGFRVLYTDGDTEDVSLRDLCNFLPLTHGESTARASAPPARPAL